MHDGKDAEELNPHETTLLTALCDADMVRIMGQCKLKTLLRMRSMGWLSRFTYFFPHSRGSGILPPDLIGFGDNSGRWASDPI